MVVSPSPRSEYHIPNNIVGGGGDDGDWGVGTDGRTAGGRELCDRSGDTSEIQNWELNLLRYAHLVQSKALLLLC